MKAFSLPSLNMSMRINTRLIGINQRLQSLFVDAD
jgi:hypothetical protein